MGETPASGRNPLGIPEILENILECLPLKDVKSSRLVNKFWRDCGVAPMKKKEKSGVRLGVRVGYVRYPADKTVEDLAAFSSCLNSVDGGSINFPGSKFFFCLSFIRRDRKNRNKDELLVADFLQKISPLATKLWLSTQVQKRIYKATFPRRVDFPKLKFLKFYAYGAQWQASDNSSRNFYQFIAIILEKAPSLQKVDFGDDEHSVDTIIKAKSSFTEMRIDGIRNKSMEKLSRWNREVKLKSLNLRFLETEVNGTSLFQLLRSQKDSLETLVLLFSYVSSLGIVSFPEMPKLKNLTIQFYHDDDDDDDDELVTFPVISYQRQFPALKALHLNQSNLVEFTLCRQFIKHDMQPVETLEELTLPRNAFDDESLIIAQNAVRIFPNVKKLTIVADSTMLPTIFQYWNNLEQLTLYPGHSCIDYLLMGHTRSGYKRIQKRIQMEGDDFDWNQLEPGNNSIVNLQKLRVLRFINEEETRKLEVTRASLHLIWSRMGSLRCVDFGNRYYPMETKIDKAWLAERNEDCVVLWNNIEHNN